MSKLSLEERMIEQGKLMHQVRTSIIDLVSPKNNKTILEDIAKKANTHIHNVRNYDYFGAVSKKIDAIRNVGYVGAEGAGAVTAFVFTYGAIVVSDALKFDPLLKTITASVAHAAGFYIGDTFIYKLITKKQLEKNDMKHLKNILLTTSIASIIYQGLTFHNFCGGVPSTYQKILSLVPKLAGPEAREALLFPTSSVIFGSIRHTITFGYGLWGKEIRDKMVSYIVKSHNYLIP